MEEILRMIENADDDPKFLDWIDVLVARFVGHPYVTSLFEFCSGDDEAISHALMFKNAPEYTRSRDALKAIRPHQGYSVFRLFNSDSWDTWQCQISWFPTSVAKFITSPHLPTEELAELHAIIQSLEWERNHGK